MGLHERIGAWENAARDDRDPHPGVPAHSRGAGLAASTPTMRMVELTQHVGVLRGYLAECVHELKGALADCELFHTFRGTSFAGVSMAQHWADLVVWEAMLNEIDVLGGIVEIGTWRGGFSGWLWAQAELRGAKFVTYDAVAPERETPGFERVDVFNNADEVRRRIEEFEEVAPVVVFCDGGNKPRELRMFAPMLKRPESMIVVHDWGTETQPEDVPSMLEMIGGGYCERMQSVTRFFKVAR